MRRLRFLFALLLFLSCYCQEETLPEPNIYAVISSDSLHALVLVGELLEPGDTFSVDTVSIDTEWVRDTFYISVIRAPLWNGVRGAEVVLKRGEQAFVLEEMQDSAGYYYADSLAFAPGEEWKLEVDYPDGRYLETRTQIPGSFEITSPLTDTFYLEDTLLWSESKGAKGYELWVLWWRTYIFEDSTYYRSDTGHFRLFPADSLPHLRGYYFTGYDSLEIFITAIDSNLYDYLMCYDPYAYYPFEVFVPNPEDYMHIEGAWGVFGSRTTIESHRYIIPPPDTSYPPVVDRD